MDFFAASPEVDSGLAFVGPVQWGTHICQFYEKSTDLEEVLVPYFRAGLERGESCLWVAGDAERAGRGAEALRAAVPDFEAARARGQIEIVGSGDWYLPDGVFEPDRVLDAWARRADLVLRQGYDGLRVIGDPLWLETPAQFAAFMDYEQRLDAWIPGRRILCVCAYCVGKASAVDVLDVVRRHRMAAAHHDGAWELLESGALTAARGRLRETMGELRHANATLEEERAASAERAETRTRMISAAGHDVRQPLHALALYLSLLDRHVASEEGRVVLAKMDLAVRTMTRTFSALLDLAKLETGGLDSEVTAHPVAETLAAAVQEAGEAIPGTAGRIRIVGSRLWVGSDPDLLEAILCVLLVNALEHAAPGKVLVGCRRDGDGVRIEVHDTGPGIPPGDLFREFVRGDSTRTLPGLGLGLAIAQRLARLLDHALTVRSVVGRGTVFAVRVPRADAADPALAPADGPERPAVPLDGVHILLADDDALAADASRGVLEEAGAVVTMARSFAEALDSAAHPFDAYVLDLDLAGDSGLDLIEALEERVGAPIPAVLVTGASSPSRLQALRTSGRPWLAKPVRAPELAGVVSGLLPPRRPVPFSRTARPAGADPKG